MKNFIYPTIIFILFLVAVIFIAFYTFDNKKESSYYKPNKTITSEEKLKKELMKRLK